MHLELYKAKNYTIGAGLVRQVLWYGLGQALFSSYLLPFSALKVAILRLFGAKIGQGVRIKPGVRIKFPWRLSIGDHVWLGEGVWIDNLAPIAIESQVCVSQKVYFCTGNHDWSDPSFSLITASIQVKKDSWLAAGTIIGPGVTIGQGAVLCLGSVACSSLEPMTIYAGNPAKPIKKRNLRNFA